MQKFKTCFWWNSLCPWKVQYISIIAEGDSVFLNLNLDPK